MRNLATIQVINNIEPIPNAEKIVKATVLGWNIVIRKDEFKISDPCVYIEIDSIVPDKPEFEFLRERKFRIKTIKLRGQISQGICFPLSILPSNYKPTIGDDVTELLGITKYEPDVYNGESNKQKSKYVFPNWFPIKLRRFLVRNTPQLAKLIIKLLPKSQRTIARSWLGVFPKTDETRVQVLQLLLDKYAGTICYVTEKLDGSSITCYKYKGIFGVCSRNLDIDKDKDNSFWQAAINMDIENKLNGFDNIALQGELVGERVQGNKYKLSGMTIFFYSIFNINTQEYLSYKEFIGLTDYLALQIVPILNTSYTLVPDIDKMVEESKGESLIGPTIREGIVIRPLNNIIDHDFSKWLVSGRVSFKSVNPEFLLKYND